MMTDVMVPEDEITGWMADAVNAIGDHAEIVWQPPPDAPIDRDDWLRHRKAGLGGSDAATTLDLNPWSSPYALWADKTTDLISDEDNEYMKWGRRLEEAIGWGISEDTGITVARYPYMLRSKKWPWLQVNLDFIAPESVVEVKNVGIRMSHEWDDGAVPDHYMLQGQHACAVTGLPGVHFFPLIGGNEARPVYVERDDALINDLVEAERKFWELVENLTPPAVDGSEATRNALKSVFANPVKEGVIELTAHQALEMKYLLQSRAEYSQAEKDAKKGKNDQENLIFAMLGNAEIAVHNGVTLVTWKKQDRKAYTVEASTRRVIHVPKPKASTDKKGKK